MPYMARDLMSTNTPPEEWPLGRGNIYYDRKTSTHFVSKCFEGPISAEDALNDVGCTTTEERPNPDENVTWKDRGKLPPGWICVAIKESQTTPHSPEFENWNRSHSKRSHNQPTLIYGITLYNTNLYKHTQ